MTDILRSKDYLPVCCIQRLGWIDIKQVGKQLQTENTRTSHSSIRQVELPSDEHGKFGEGVSLL